MTTFDGIGFGNGPPRAWSHYGPGDLRCDIIPVLHERTQQFICPAHGVPIMTVERAHADRLLPFRVPEPAPPPIKGFVWTGEFYERLVEPNPIDVAVELQRASYESIRKHPEWWQPQPPPLLHRLLRWALSR